VTSKLFILPSFSLDRSSYFSLQLCPFPYDYVQEEAEKYHNAEITWAQEEPKNMGYWSYVKPRIETATGRNKEVR
jgi:2-oxoglutarate dehydrogenase E1 component